MKCPYCAFLDSKVVDSRPDKGGATIKRRRECESCGKRFTTHERVEEVLPLVTKRDGRREPFERMKLIVGIQKACEKRPVSVETIEKLVDRIEIRMQESGEKEIETTTLGDQGEHLFDPLVGGETLAAGLALAAAPDGGPTLVGTGIDHLGIGKTAEGTLHSGSPSTFT